MEVFLNGQRFQLDPQQAIGKGGEADVFAIGQGLALKIFKAPQHPDYQGQAYEQQQAKARLAEHQRKLPAFPRHLPGRVVRPQALATNRSGRKILGYSMQHVQGAVVLRRYAERSFRQAGVSAQTVTALFRDLHRTVTALHQAGVVIGDFNDLNVLVRGDEAWLIDADSMQFGRFLCTVFTARFVDPLLCRPGTTSLLLQQPHTPASDWYAFTVMLMQCLLFVGPYGGVYAPHDPARRIPHEARPLQRITIFHPDVQYPKPALPYHAVPDDLLQHWHLVFEKDARGAFPLPLLDALHWQRCQACGLEHARHACPRCRPTAPLSGAPVLCGRGSVTARSLFRTSGEICYATLHADGLHWLYRENGRLHREDGGVVWDGPLAPHTRYRLCGDKTLLGQDDQMLTVQPGHALERMSVDRHGLVPLFDANTQHRYWVDRGQLWRDGGLGPAYIGDVLAGQTHFWVGTRFGFGLYRAGSLAVAFVFDAERSGLNDTVPLPPLRGQWLEVTCVFTDTQCWLFTATQVQGRTLHQCVLIAAQGAVIARAEAVQDDGSWLGTIGGKTAAGPWLFAPTDAGIVRLEVVQGAIVQTRLFADTEPFVDSACQLFASPQGLYVVDRQEIRLLRMS